jgi:hypothetical protein
VINRKRAFVIILVLCLAHCLGGEVKSANANFDKGGAEVSAYPGPFRISVPPPQFPAFDIQYSAGQEANSAIKNRTEDAGFLPLKQWCVRFVNDPQSVVGAVLAALTAIYM